MSNYAKINSKNIINNHVANDIRTFVAKNSNFQEMRALQNQYVSLLDEYENTPALIVSSTIRMDRLGSFNKWMPEAMQDYTKVIPFLVSNMFKGDIYSLNIFENIYRGLNKENILLCYSNILNDKNLKNTFSRYGGAEDARAIMTAERWLESSDAADIFQKSNDIDILCAVNTMLHINNEFIQC